MEKEHIKIAILNQERMFRQQVHELHRVYHLQKQLMKDMQIVELNRAHCYRNSDERKPPFAEDFDLELTLATGSSKSQRRKHEKSSNSDSGATVSSSSAESELGRFHKSDATLRFQNENKRHDELMQSPWLYQCLSLKMA